MKNNLKCCFGFKRELKLILNPLWDIYTLAHSALEPSCLFLVQPLNCLAPPSDDP